MEGLALSKERLEPQVALLYDIARVEEKLLLKALKALGVRVVAVHVRKHFFRLGGPMPAQVSLIRAISMHRALHAAALAEAAGSLTINSSLAIMLAGDKLLGAATLKRGGIEVPETFAAFSMEGALDALGKVGYPGVLKPPIGGWGRLVTRVRDPEEARSVLEHREQLPSPLLRTYLVQEYLNTGGRDLRCLVLGDELLGCVERKAGNGEWRSNIALGAIAKPHAPDPELEDLALRAAGLLGLRFAGLDVFEDPERGYLVNEANAVPEFKGFSTATGIDVAGKLARHIKDLVKR